MRGRGGGGASEALYTSLLTPASDRGHNLGGHDVRLIVAQDLGDKAKVVLLDTQRPLDAGHGNGNVNANSRETVNDKKGCAMAHGQSLPPPPPPLQPPRRPSQPPPSPSLSLKESSSTSPELVTELMFGTVPLSYRGTSVRVHALPTTEASGSRSFLFTKVFTVNVAAGPGTGSPRACSSGTASLSSSLGSVSAMREYPFPTMTPITDGHHNGSAARPPSRERSHERDRGPSQSKGGRAGGGLLNCHQRQASHSASQHHHRAPSAGTRSELGDVAPYVPFTKQTETNQAHDNYFSGWLPSPGPVLAGRRRRSVDTDGSHSPGSNPGGGGSGGGGRFQAAMCAIGIIFTVPGDGHEHTECALMTRHWQMMNRATYALQGVVYDEIELALNFITAHGTVQTPRSRTRPSKGEAQVYQRGKKYYVALGQHCLGANQKVTEAVDDFRARLAGGINLPEILHKPLILEVDILVEELSFMLDTLDRKETKFIFSSLMTFMVDHVAAIKSGNVGRDQRQSNSLRDRIVIVSDNAVLARRLIFCIARLFFRGHNEHLQTAVDYALVWPSSGLLRMPRRDLLRKRQSSLAKATRANPNPGWDIPRHGRPLSSGSYNMPLVSPSIYHRAPSTMSNASSRGSSWKPSWSWFANSSRSALNIDDGSRSDTKTMQTSWNSADFAEIVKSPAIGKFPRSWSPTDCDNSATPPTDDTATDDDDEDDEDGGISVETTVPSLRLEARKDADGTVDVSYLDTVSIHPETNVSEIARLDEVHSQFPLTGVLSRFHPDMLLQAISPAAYIDSQLRDYLAEEELYVRGPQASDGKGWNRTASVTVAELGHTWRLRRLTRLMRNVTGPEVSEACADNDARVWSASTSCGSSDLPHATTTTATDESSPNEESWTDEVLTDINEPLMQNITKTIERFRVTKDTTCVQTMIDALHYFAVRPV